MKICNDIEKYALEQGAFRTATIDVCDIETSDTFLSLCEANACGVYGKCYMCPPDIGDIKELIASLSQYKKAVVFQTVTPLEDSYDFEGMTSAKKAHKALCFKIKAKFSPDNLYLGTGGCGVCERCAKREGIPCRAPHLAMSSLEAYGINVTSLAKVSGMKYINGQNTVTYFGAVFIK